MPTGGLATELMAGTFDLALTDSLLLGLKLGFYVHPTNVNVVFSLPIIFEGRVAWILGNHPLTVSGIRPYAFVGGGVADFSSAIDTPIGSQSVTAWRVAGPGFVSFGLGVRIGTPRFQVLIAPLKMALAVGNGTAVGFMPELSIMAAPF